MESYFLLILVCLFFLAIVAMAATAPSYRSVIGWMMFFQFLVGVVLSPADGGDWSRRLLFFYGSFDAICWLLRRELAPIVEQQTGQGFLIRLLLLTSPIWFAIVYTAIRTATG